MNKKVVLQQILRTLMVAGELVFIAVVAILQILQPEYDAIAQPMSELALGIHGQYMLLAFTALAMTVAAAAFIVRSYSPGLFWLLFVAAWCFLAAGLVTLQASMWIHLLCVGGCFCFMWYLHVFFAPLCTGGHVRRPIWFPGVCWPGWRFPLRWLEVFCPQALRRGWPLLVY